MYKVYTRWRRGCVVEMFIQSSVRDPPPRNKEAYLQYLLVTLKRMLLNYHKRFVSFVLHMNGGIWNMFKHSTTHYCVPRREIMKQQTHLIRIFNHLFTSLIWLSFNTTDYCFVIFFNLTL